MVFLNWLIICKRNNDFADVHEQAEDLFLQLAKQVADRESVIEQLKVENQAGWLAN